MKKKIIIILLFLLFLLFSDCRHDMFFLKYGEADLKWDEKKERQVKEEHCINELFLKADDDEAEFNVLLENVKKNNSGKLRWKDVVIYQYYNQTGRRRLHCYVFSGNPD
jgi:hypothetical protein